MSDKVRQIPTRDRVTGDALDLIGSLRAEIKHLRAELAEARSYQANYEHATKLEREEAAKALAEAQQARDIAEQLAKAGVFGKATAERHVVTVCGERDTYARLLRRAQEEMRLLHMKDLATVYDVTLRHEIATALGGVSEPASGVPSAEWIDQNSVQCDACHHEFVDLTAIKEGGKQHAIAGDSEGQGTGCAFCMDADAEMHAKESASERIRGGE